MDHRPTDERDIISLVIGACFGIMAVVIFLGFNTYFPLSRRNLGAPPRSAP